MTKEKLAIVSSYNDFCGNASYTRALVAELSKYFDVSVISLNVELLRSGDAKGAREHVKEIREQLKAFPYVNIQFEAGLFGNAPRFMKRRFFAIAKSCRNMVLTMHRYHGKEKIPGIISLGKVALRQAKFKDFLSNFKSAYANNRHLPLYDTIIRYCVRKKIPIIIHTQRDRELIKTKFHYPLVFDHPLCFYSQDFIGSVSGPNARKEFCEKLGLDEDKTYIGIFGFISGYKGYETAIRALEYLPEQYELLIFGSQHPQLIRLEEPVNGYIGSLLNLITSLKLGHRVKFYKSPNDDDFLKAMIACDFNVLPYLEVNQGGSAIAALSLETNSKTIFSQNRAFFELEKYAPNSFKTFTIGNYLELANAILRYRPAEFRDNLQAYHKKYNIQTSGSLYKKLLTEVS